MAMTWTVMSSMPIDIFMQHWWVTLTFLGHRQRMYLFSWSSLTLARSFHFRIGFFVNKGKIGQLQLQLQYNIRLLMISLYFEKVESIKKTFILAETNNFLIEPWYFIQKFNTLKVAMPMPHCANSLTNFKFNQTRPCYHELRK